MRQSGYALIVILLLLALVLISLAVAVEPVLRTAKREKEEELIFRGEQYERAIGRFYRKFGRFPLKMEELIRTNDRNFLRHPFPDPMTHDGQWRIIRLGPNGQLMGSRHQAPTEPQTEDKTKRPATMGASRSAGTSPSTSPASSPSPRFSLRSGMSSGGVNYPIIGVASNSSDSSIRVYDGYVRYNDWEFIYDPTKEALGKAAGAGAVPGSDAGATDKSRAKPRTKN